MSLSEWWNNWRAIRARLIRETRFPLALALVWGIFSYIKKPELFSVFGDFVTAFTFTFYLSGQLFRMAKNVRDEENAANWNDRFDSIEQGLNALRGKAGVKAIIPPLPSRPNLEDTQYVDRVPGFIQAAQAIQTGLHYPGAVMAAVGFEQAMRHLAELAEMNTHHSLAFIVERMTRGSDMREQLQNLVRLRNSLIHSAHPQQVTTELQAREILDAFRAGVTVLEQKI